MHHTLSKTVFDSKMVSKDVCQNTFWRIEFSRILHFLPNTLLKYDLYLWGHLSSAITSSFLTRERLWTEAPFSFVHQAFDWWLIAADVFIYYYWNLNSKVVIASSVLIGLVRGCHFTIICKSSNYQVWLEEKYHSPAGFCGWKCLLEELEKNTLSIMKLAWKCSIFAPTVINNSKQTNKK